MNEPTKISSDTYKGPGRLSSAIGSSALMNIGGGLVGTAGGAALGMLTGKGVSRVGRTIGYSLIGGFALSLIGGVVGLFTGWRNANKGHAQFEEMKGRYNQVLVDNAELRSANTALENINEMNAKRFTDEIAPREKHHGAHVAHERAAELTSEAARG